MPQDSTPRILPRLIFTPPGSSAPSSAQHTSAPARTFGAPQTICSGSSLPTFTVQMCRWSLSGCISQVSTRPTTTFVNFAVFSQPSTAVPVMIMRRAYSSAGMSIFVYSFSHFIDTFIVYALLNP